MYYRKIKNGCNFQYRDIKTYFFPKIVYLSTLHQHKSLQGIKYKISTKIWKRRILSIQIFDCYIIKKKLLWSNTLWLPTCYVYYTSTVQCVNRVPRLIERRHLPSKPTTQHHLCSRLFSSNKPHQVRDASFREQTDRSRKKKTLFLLCTIQYLTAPHHRWSEVCTTRPQRSTSNLRSQIQEATTCLFYFHSYPTTRMAKECFLSALECCLPRWATVEVRKVREGGRTNWTDGI